MEGELSGHRDESPQTRRLLERHQELAERLEQSGYARRRERIERVLAGLGFAREEFGKPVGEFSQGWRMRIGLARVLCEQADILLLDEPTNYLDLEARTWLEQYLRDTPAGVLVVSHDRWFLDTTADTVAELYGGKLTLYPGSFSAYERRREAELAQIEAAYERQQEEIARMEVFIRRFRYKASKARQVQSRLGQLERVARIQPPPVQKRIHFHFPDPPHGGNLALRLQGLGKAYGDKRLFRGLDLELSRGEKLALVGPNGAGKSTLMRLLARQEPPSEGAVVHGAGLSLGYYSPDHPEELSGTESVLERVESWAPTHLIPQLRSLLGAFLFRDDEVFKPVGVLSGGEKSRLALLSLLLHPVNCLFLDEPTNHLDLLSKDVLLDALVRYPGTLVFVSHDRYFIEKLATRVLELEGGRARVFPGRLRLLPVAQAEGGRGRGHPAKRRMSPRRRRWSRWEPGPRPPRRRKRGCSPSACRATCAGWPAKRRGSWPSWSAWPPRAASWRPPCPTGRSTATGPGSSSSKRNWRPTPAARRSSTRAGRPWTGSCDPCSSQHQPAELLRASRVADVENRVGGGAAARFGSAARQAGRHPSQGEHVPRADVPHRQGLLQLLEAPQADDGPGRLRAVGQQALGHDQRHGGRDQFQQL